MNPRDSQVDAVAVESMTRDRGQPPELRSLEAEAHAGGWQEKDTPVGAPARPQTVAGTRGAATGG